MVSLKGHAEETYLQLLESLVASDPLDLTPPRYLRKDCETLTSRAHAEGLSFLTKTLPLLGKALDAGLASLRFTKPREFKSSAENRSIPAFMQTYFNLIFDCDGFLREDADASAVKHLRQVLFFVYKLELGYSESEEARVIAAFEETERQLEVGGSSDTVALMEAASYIAREVFAEFDHRDILPRHGPGAVATGEKLEEKWAFARLYNGIHQVYPYYEYFVVGGGRELIDRLGWYRRLQRLESGVAKVVLVPKDSRGPRLISCEPLEYQWIQQGLGRKLVSHLESHRLTGGQINFKHQEVNRKLALENSITREYATLDLKDASDRVSVELVTRVFGKVPSLLRALLATRTTATKLPDGRILPLKKYAPMGSALCFPVEAFVFWSVIVAAICRDTGRPPRDVGKRVFVFGDDIVVPTEWASASVHALESVALKVNGSKCCIQGPFRESCGMDAFKGVCVTPTRLRKLWSNQASDGTAFAAYVAYANSLSASGYSQTADLIWGMLERVYGKVPYGTSSASYPCRLVPNAFEAELRNLLSFRWRWSSKYQRIEFRVKRVQPRKRGSKLDGWLRLLRDTLTPGLEDPSSVVLPKSTFVNLGWAPV